MPHINSSFDGAQIYYADYRPAQKPIPFQPSERRETYVTSDVAIVFIHGWPMSSKMYEHLILSLSESYGIRSIAIDRRGFGKSEWNGSNAGGDITYDVFAADNLTVIKSVPDLKNFIFVAASMGCGETVLTQELMREQGIGNRCKGFIWLGPSLPFPIETEKSPGMPTREIWDSLIMGFRQDRVGFVQAAIGSVFGIPSGIQMSASALEFFINVINQADAIAIERCVQIITSYDFTDKLKGLVEQRVLIIHGDSDQGMPAEPSAHVVKTLIPGSEVKIYEKAAHGLYYTHASKVLEDILKMYSEISKL